MCLALLHISPAPAYTADREFKHGTKPALRRGEPSCGTSQLGRKPIPQ
jgi:hypothetical protein